MTYINEIKEILQRARSKSLQAVNSAMVEAYWQIGKRIVEQEQEGTERAKYGEAILKELSINLTQEFGKGFSEPNLRNFRQFFLTYPDFQICYTLCNELSWSLISFSKNIKFKLNFISLNNSQFYILNSTFLTIKNVYS